MSDNGYTYEEQPKIPKGHWRSVFGGFERTPLAGYLPGATVTEITRDPSPAARRARVRARKRDEKMDLEQLLEATLAALEDDESTIV